LAGRPWLVPGQPEISLNAGSERAEGLAEQIIGLLKDKGII